MPAGPTCRTETGTVATNGAWAARRASRGSAVALRHTTAIVDGHPKLSLTRLTSHVELCIRDAAQPTEGPLNGSRWGRKRAATALTGTQYVRTNVSTAAGTTVASRTGRDANPTSPLRSYS